MYLEHWKLKRPPFPGGHDPRLFFAGAVQEEALARMGYLVDEGRRGGLLLGDPGTGKSFLLRQFASQIRQRGHAVARVGLLGLDRRSAVWAIAAQLGTSPRVGEDEFTWWRMIEDRIQANHHEQQTTVLLLDDVDAIDPAAEIFVSQLARYDSDSQPKLTIVFAGSYGQQVRSDQHLLESIDLRIDIAEWEEAETIRFLADTIREAGCDGSVFTEEAGRLVHDLSRGIARSVVQIANLAMIAAAGQGSCNVDAATVQQVYDELGTVDLAAFSPGLSESTCVTF